MKKFNDISSDEAKQQQQSDLFGFLEEFNNLIKEGEELIKKYKK